MSAAAARLRNVGISNGAPSARNLLVTLFGDALLPHGVDVAASVRSLTALIEPFDVNERLVRTSLTRLVNDGLLASRSLGRRSFYGVEASAVPLFRSADARIYGPRSTTWDGCWTVVVIDGNEGTAAHRARLRQRLTWAGLGVVAPNVMASPIVSPADAALVVEQVGGFDHVLVTRSELHDAPGTLDADELARRCAPIDEIAVRYREFVDTFEDLDPASLAALADADAFKLRTWLVATYRRIVLVDPLLPAALLPDGWAGATARALAAAVYSGVAEASERHLAATVELPEGAVAPDPTWLHGRFVVGETGAGSGRQAS